MDDLLTEFYEEINEYSVEISRELENFEHSPDRKQSIQRILRALHSMKTACGFLKLKELERTVDDAETTLSAIFERPGELRGGVSSIQAAIEPIRKMITMLPNRPAARESINLADMFRNLESAVQDLSDALGKDIALHVDCDEIKLPPDITRHIKYAALHIIRNAADHGLEDTASRRKAGKAPEGRITINANRVANAITITIADDGRGLPLDHIRKKMIANGAVTERDAASLPPEKLARYIFEPGFSTSAAVNMISGRGIGLDAVRSELAAVKADISVATETGKNTVFTITIPV